MISIFVAGTVELSGSKSPIVAMAIFYFFFVTSFESFKLSPILSYTINSPVTIVSLFHAPETVE